MRYLQLIVILGFTTELSAQQSTTGSGTTLQVESSAILYFGGSCTLDGSLANEGSTIIESDGELNGDIINDGDLLIKGDGALDVNASLTTNVGSNFNLEGNGIFDGPINNGGSIFLIGDLSTVINSTITNSGSFGFDTDMQLNGTFDNEGLLGVTGNAIIDGTLTNSALATASFENNFTLNSDLNNLGILSIGGTAILTSTFMNANEAIFTGSTSFDGATTNNASFVIGGNTIFNETLINNGDILTYADVALDFVDNKSLGNLSFHDLPDSIPITEVTILSNTDSIAIADLNIDTQGKVSLPTNFVSVKGTLNIENGVLNATNQESFIVEGTITINAENAASTFVEGKMLAATGTNETVFPMGINGLPNYLSVNSSTPGVLLKVECKMPDADILLTNAETLGLAQEVVWTIQTLEDSVELAVSISFSGVDFTNAPNFVNAQQYDATLQKFAKGDSLFSALRSIDIDITNSVDLFGISVPESGSIKTSTKLWVTTEPTVFAIGLSPILTEPEVYLPNVFAPRGKFTDNTVFRPFVGGTTIQSIDFSVFDSFNRAVYSENLTGEDIDLETIGWDGTLGSGQDAPEGVYYYKVNIQYTASEEVSIDYFSGNGGSQVQSFNKLGSVLLVK